LAEEDWSVDIDERAVLTYRPAASIRQLTVNEYHRMGEAGIFAESERVELIEGQLIAMSPIGSPHFAAVNTLNRLLVRAVGDLAIVSVQNPVRLNDRSEPEPDLTLIRPRDDEYRSALPGPPDVLLIIEVASSSIDYDRGVKLDLYARHNISEVWIVNLDLARVEVYRSPNVNCGSYSECSHIYGDGTVEIASLPGVVIHVAPIFG
jgi:Uma2 family endonuclease